MRSGDSDSRSWASPSGVVRVVMIPLLDLGKEFSESAPVESELDDEVELLAGSPHNGLQWPVARELLELKGVKLPGAGVFFQPGLAIDREQIPAALFARQKLVEVARGELPQYVPNLLPPPSGPG